MYSNSGNTKHNTEIHANSVISGSIELCTGFLKLLRQKVPYDFSQNMNRFTLREVQFSSETQDKNDENNRHIALSTSPILTFQSQDTKYLIS